MKQSVDLINSMKLMKSRHSNTTNATTGLARRALLLVTLFLMSVGSAWGDFTPAASIPEPEVQTPNLSFNESTKTISVSNSVNLGYKTAGLTDNNGYARFYVTEADGSTPVSITSMTLDGETVTNYDSYGWAGNGIFYDYDQKVTIVVANTNAKILHILYSTSSLSGEQEPSIAHHYTYVIGADIVDNFPGEKKSGATEESYITKYLTTETEVPIEIAKATHELPSGTSAKYARFYVLHNGVSVNLKSNTSLLNISGISPEKQSPSLDGTNGYYLYNSGSDLDLSGISVKLNAAAGEFPDYQVVCLLSTDAAKAATGNVVTEEPDWDVVFTYSFRNQVTTKNQTGIVAWDAVAMTAEVTSSDLANDWGTTWANLAQEQKIEWYVVDGSNEKQPLAIGTARAADTWTINLPAPFSIVANVATMTGQNTYTAASFETEWDTWGKPAIYAPANKSFADVQNYKIVCKIADDTNSSANTNVVYTLSLTNTELGQAKSTMVKETKQVKLANATDKTNEIAIELPSGTKYARFYVLDNTGAAVDATDAAHQLTVTDGKTFTDKTLGYYVYSDALALSGITFTSSSANLDDYQVVMVTSTEMAVNTSGTVTYEPDYEKQTTYWFNYPATTWGTEANVEWSPQSMQITAPDIETQKGAGYLAKKKAHYTLQWEVIDKNGEAQMLQPGTARVNDRWVVNVNGDPFTASDKKLSVSNNSNLSVANWNKWTAPVFFAPKNMTLKQIADKEIKFVCKFYEDDDASDDTRLAMTYTIFIDRTQKPGKLKDGGKRGGETVTTIAADATETTIDLTKATTAFEAEISKKAKYARVYLTKNDGTMLNPTTSPEKLENVGGTPFTTPEYGYYFQDEASGVTLPTNAKLTLPAGKFNYYYVVVAMSSDTGETGHTGTFARKGAASVESTYEPDFDYIYTIKFSEVSDFPGTEAIAYSHSKEVLVKDEAQTTATMSLADNLSKILGEYTVADWATLRSSFHIRWYVAKKNDEGEYVKIPGSENYLQAVTAGVGHQGASDQGLYWNFIARKSDNTSPSATEVLNITINRNPGGSIPELTGEWEDYKVIAVMTKDHTGQTVVEDKDTYNNVTARYLTKEPTTLDMKYMFSFFKESTFQFVHDKGASGRDFLTKSTNPEINASVQQYQWINSTSTIQPVSGDIRQSVHTVEYDLYVDPSSTTPVALHLPFQKYTDTGNNLEPAAYIRWYDWTTDINNNRLAKVGAKLNDLSETNNGVTVSRGYFFLNNDENALQPIHNMVGVTFNPQDISGQVTIACDVSKYYDGIYTDSESKEYLMHEPTLSTRYIFHIRPASVIADAIKKGQEKFEAHGSDMFELAEDNGRFSISIKGNATEYAVRTALPTLGSYYFYNGGSLVQATRIQWVAYYQDENNKWWYKTWGGDNIDANRIKQFSVDKFNSSSGSYVSLDDGTTTMSESLTIGAGTRLHLVGFLYTDDSNIKAPAIHYELNFINAPAYPIESLPLERTEAYLHEHMQWQATVNFDNLKDGATVITEVTDVLPSQLQNHSTMPVSWNQAQYGFCYPDVRRIWTQGGADYSGISPIHGDYMLLKSMNATGISESDKEHYYKYHWYVETPTLYDYTYNYGDFDDLTKSVQNKGRYGSFLYVDASDESRTIAKMRFDASLCAGSELCFIGSVANMTTGTSQPQVVASVYGVKGDGSRVRVVAFHSSELGTNSIEGTYKNGQWYQIYGKVPIPSSVDLSDVDHYEVEIDNYARNTDGADYCVDQLKFYTSTAKLKVKQGPLDCSTDMVKMNVYIDATAVKDYAGKNLYWRICDEAGNPMSADMELYVDNGQTLTYGTTPITAVPATLSDETTFFNSGTDGYFLGDDGVTYFSLANKYFNLEQGKKYYIGVYQLGETAVIDENDWADNTDPCDIFSPIFVPKMMYLEMQNDSHVAQTTVAGSCSDSKANINLNVVLQMPDDDEVSGFRAYDAVKFDFFLGTLAEFKAYHLTGNDAVKLEDALQDYRGKNGGVTTYQSTEGLASGYGSGTSDNYKVIQQAITAGLLFLDAKNTFNHQVTGDVNNKAYVSALPIDDKVNNGTTDFNICSPLEFVFDINVSGSSPQLTLGFEDVDYSSVTGIRVVRVGKEQLDNMQKNGGFLLHIPVNTFKKSESATAKDGTLQIQGDLELLKYKAGADQTTDVLITDDVNKVATFEGDKEITSSKMFISVNFHSEGVTKPAFHEGFAYRMFFQVKDKDGGSGACEGNVEFLLKVVPKYVTWQGTTAEWNNDANWKRSTRTELYKGAKGTDTNSDDYENNAEGGLSTVTTTPNTFVPMKFTYVTLPTGKRAPNLVNLAYSSEGIYNNIGTGATGNIQYDLMVRYTEKVCQSTTEHGGISATADIYDCEKFYGNWAKELYMKPNAELLNQQWLTYEKVWVEKELKANTWTLMSTPLQNTYAGDMYVPYSTTATANGRQTSEAFQPISFSTTANAGFAYSRTKYPIYQKGWTQEGVFVQTKTNDVRANQYSANIPGGVSYYLNQWSHEYNDVTVSYSTWTAFAIRAHKKDQKDGYDNDVLALIRLPKNDTSYDYYQWDNTSPTEGKITGAVGKTTTGKLLTDRTANISGVTYGTKYGTTDATAGDGNFNAALSDVQSAHGYQLVGNPYLCSIDMAKFVTENTANLDEAGYWTYSDNNTSSKVTGGTIAPMQSFFVKMKSGATGVVFKPDMMVDGHTVATPAHEFMLLTARNNRGSSVAGLAHGEQQQVEAFFDSNIADVPVVYTVGDGQALSMNRMENLLPVSFGVTYSGNDPVEVTFSDIEQLTDGDVFVVDAVEGKTQQIYEGDSFTVQPNDYGRYFLAFAGDLTGIETTLPKQDGTDGEKVIFDLQGRRVIYPGKGIYIVNGKKFLYK